MQFEFLRIMSHDHEACIETLTITPKALEAFEEIFVDWKETYPNSDHLEAGGTGDLYTLAQAVLVWSRASS